MPPRTLPILHLDSRFAVVDKPAGLVVHRGGWADDDVVAMTIVRDQLGRAVFPVHRLDRGTSGVLLFALDPESAHAAQRAFETGSVDKRYWALVRGVAPDAITVDHPVQRAEEGPRVPAVTELRRLALSLPIDVPSQQPGELPRTTRFSLVEARPRTGRLHQIRRHCKHLGHPLLGDVNYGRGELNRLARTRLGLHRLALHARSLALTVDDVTLHVEAPLPADLAVPFAALGLPTH